MPYYQLSYKLHLPKDPPWRDENRNIHRRWPAQKPDDLWQTALVDISEMLGFKGDDNLVAGLLLNVINKLPDDLRAAIAGGIVNGLGLNISKGRGTKRLNAKVVPLFKPLVAKEPESGLVIPATPKIYVPGEKV